MSISASGVRNTLVPHTESVNADHISIILSPDKEDAVLLATEESESREETAYRFRSPANARRIPDANAQARTGNYDIHDLRRDQYRGRSG
ncbi:type II toxin-antitoxin system Phd/YefM family antitoxin [Glutamicibacter ardleyensis]|uniref:type II toxin-antitoxin system Phd/YefM family antitoxin n=1 Tax=Glutamicibacter ardleyensis TaxID=225894 RepID=UPI003FD4E003